MYLYRTVFKYKYYFFIHSVRFDFLLNNSMDHAHITEVFETHRSENRVVVDNFKFNELG